MLKDKNRCDSFVLELPLKVSPKQEKSLLKRLEAVRQLYNSCLSEALRRLKLIRDSKNYQKVCKLQKGPNRSKAFKKLNAHFGFREYDLHSFAIRTKNACWIGDHLDTHVCQKVATRAFDAVQKYALGQRGRPRFKGRNQFDSVEGKSNASGIRWRDGKVVWLSLQLSAVFDPKDKHGVQAHSLACPTKYVRLVRRKIRGKNRFYVQLIQEGKPKIKEKNKVGDGVVGLDLGPSTIAAVGDSDAFLKSFCSELEPIEKEIRLIQRKLDRSRRATNPQNYNPDGTVKKGKLVWKYSNRYIQERNKLSDLYRKHAAYRDSLQGRLVNEVLAMGKFLNTEDVSYKAWQRIFGKSVSFRAPGTFMEKLRRKAESAGGGVNEFRTSVKLSQFCHGCETYSKKPLSQRWHRCECGIVAQRDLYSAFLARLVVGDSLDISRAKAAWPGAEPLLWRAMSRLNETASGKLRFASFGLGSWRQSGLHAEGGSTHVEAEDVVVPLRNESSGEICGTATRTPCL